MRRERLPRLHVPQTLAHPRWSLSKCGWLERLISKRRVAWVGVWLYHGISDKDVLYPFARRDSQAQERQVVVFRAS